MNLLKETVEETREELYVSADTDAKVGHKSTDSEVFMYNKDADMMQCRAGYLSYKKEKRQTGGNKNDRLLYYFDVEKCRNRPFKKGCHKEGAGTKIYSVVIKSGDFKVKSKERYKIEAKNSGLRNVHGCDTAVCSGLDNMKMQGACTVFVVNLKRIFTLMDQKQ